MCVKLPATLNIQLEYVCTKFVGTIILSPRKKKSPETLSAVIKTVSSPQGWEFDSKWRPRVGKLTFENEKCRISRGLRLPPPPPILGQAIDRCIKKKLIAEVFSQCTPPQAHIYTTQFVRPL